LRRGRADRRRGRRPAALGQDARPRRRAARRAVPAVRGLPRRARRARPDGRLRQRLHGPGARAGRLSTTAGAARRRPVAGRTFGLAAARGWWEGVPMVTARELSARAADHPAVETGVRAGHATGVTYL